MIAVTPGAEIVELAGGVYARLHEGLTNAGVIVGDDGVLVIDSLRVPSFARDLIQDVRHLSDKPIRYVIDTHSHWDHSWGNEEFPDSTIIGHANCRSENAQPRERRMVARQSRLPEPAVVGRGEDRTGHAAQPHL